MKNQETKEMTIFDHIASETFKSKVKSELKKIEKSRSQTISKIGHNVKFKRSAIDYLDEIGKYSPSGIAELLPDIIEKKSTLPSSVRQFINQLTYKPLTQTVSEYMQRDQLEKKNEPEAIKL